MDDRLVVTVEDTKPEKPSTRQQLLLLPADSQIMRASAHFTKWVRYFLYCSLLQFFTPHGIIGIFWSIIWLCRSGYDGGGDDNYFERMDVLRLWVLRANGLRYNVRLAVAAGLAGAILAAVLIPAYLGMQMSRQDSHGSISLVVTPLVLVLLASATHVAVAAVRVLPAAAAFVAAATPSLEVRLLSRDESTRFQTESLSAARTARALGIDRFVGQPSLLMTGQAVEAVRGLDHFLCVPEVDLLRGLLEGSEGLLL